MVLYIRLCQHIKVARVINKLYKLELNVDQIDIIIDEKAAKF